MLGYYGRYSTGPVAENEPPVKLPPHPDQERPFFRGQHPGPQQAAPVAAQEPAAAPLLTDREVRDAIIYMRNTYAVQSIRLLRQRFGLAEGQLADRALVMAIAQWQESRQMADVDGKLGPASFSAIQSEGGEIMQDVVFFRVSSPLGGHMEMLQGGGLTSMVGHFQVEVRLPPGENCNDYEYRQFICGNVSYVPATAGLNDPDVSLNNLFTVPGGNLPPIPNYREDGNTTLNARYGHRDQPARPENHYLNEAGREDQQNGCIFRSWDRPGITDRACQTGELYDFDFRFRGEVRHRNRGVIATRFWNVTETFTIP